MPATAIAAAVGGAAPSSKAAMSRCASNGVSPYSTRTRRSPPCARAGHRAPGGAARTASPVPRGGSWTTVCGRRDGARDRSIRGRSRRRSRPARAAAAPREWRIIGRPAIVHHLGCAGFHPRALAGGEDDGGETGRAHGTGSAKVMRNVTRSRAVKLACSLGFAKPHRAYCKTKALNLSNRAEPPSMGAHASNAPRRHRSERHTDGVAGN